LKAAPRYPNNGAGSSEKTSANCRRWVKIVGSWFIPTALRDEAPQAVDACEIEAWERHIRKITEEHRFTGFPC
jgi:hypothetical protein